jgi:hypothetical protein
MVTNIEICKDFYINLLVTDIVLLIIMLLGLLRLRMSGCGTLYLTHLLWKQVGHRPVLVGRDVVVSLHSTGFRVSFGSLLPPSQNSRKW